MGKVNRAKVIADAHKYLAKGNLKRAVKEYEKVLKDDPSDIRTKLKVADLLFRLGDRERATATFQEVAQFYAGQGFLLKAVAVFKQVQKLKPDDVDIYLSLAALYQQIGLVGDAIAQYRDAIALLEKTGDAMQRLKTAQKMLELDPDNARLRISLAEDFSREGLIEESVQEFRAAYEALRRQGLDEESVLVAERLLYHQPDDWETAKAIAAHFIAQKDGLRALSRLQVCYRFRPNDPDVLELLAQVFEFLGQPQKAATVLKSLARQFDRTGLIRERDEVFQRVLALSPGDQVAAEALRFGSAVPVKSGDEIVFETSSSKSHEEILVADEEIGIDELLEDTSPEAGRPLPPAEPPPLDPGRFHQGTKVPEIPEIPDIPEVPEESDLGIDFEERTLVQPMTPFQSEPRPSLRLAGISVPVAPPVAAGSVPTSGTPVPASGAAQDVVPEAFRDDVQNLEFLVDVGMTEDALDLIAELRRKAGDLPILARIESRIRSGAEA